MCSSLHPLKRQSLFSPLEKTVEHWTASQPPSILVFLRWIPWHSHDRSTAVSLRPIKSHPYYFRQASAATARACRAATTTVDNLCLYYNSNSNTATAVSSSASAGTTTAIIHGNSLCSLFINVIQLPAWQEKLPKGPVSHFPQYLNLNTN